MSFNLPEPIVDALLRKLGTDDEFRALFANDARGALASLGYSPAADLSISEGIWTCVTVTHLASKEVIKASHDALRAQLLARTASLHPITLQITLAARKVA
jgi:putative modified peptide